LKALVRVTDRILSRFLILLMAVMVLVVTWQVIGRFVLRSPSSYTEELARFLLIWIGMLGAVWAFRTRSHLGIQLLIDTLSGWRRKAVQRLILVLVMLFATGVLFLGGMRLVQLTFTLGQTSAAMGIPMGYVYAVLPFSGVLIILYAGFEFYALSSHDPQQREGSV